MKLKDCRESYYYNSAKASDISRNLGLAGLALIWAFRVTGDAKPTIPGDLRWAAVLLVVGLGLDFLQYILGTIVWGGYQRIKELKDTSEEDDFLAPRMMNWPANTCFALKQVAIFLAYVLLASSMRDSFWN